MLGSIEELEKDIELFQQNMAASGELQILLKQMLEQIKQQSSEFGTQSSALISRVDNLPSTIENANISSNNRVKNDVAIEIDRALQSFANEQSRYLQGLEQTKQQVQSYIEQSQFQEKAFSDKTTTVVTKVDGILVAVETENQKSNARIKADVEIVLQGAHRKFAEEQAKYIHELEETKQQLQNYIEQSQFQEKTFSDKTTTIVTKVDGIPTAVEAENQKSNAQIKADVETALQGALQKFADEQTEYLQALERTKQQLQSYIEQFRSQEKTFGEKTVTIVAKVDGIPSAVEAENLKSNALIKADIEVMLQRTLQKFVDEQSKYLHAIKNMEQQIQKLMNQSDAQGKAFADGVASAIAKFDESAREIVDDNSLANTALKAEIDKLLVERNATFAEEQNKYLASLQQTQSEIKNCESQLTVKYAEFIDTLHKMNISNLYDQNVQLKNELNKRTTILVIISAISVIVGIVGIIL